MHHRRWLFVACVTLSHACDSKPTAPPAEKPPEPTAAPQVVVTSVDPVLPPLDRSHDTLRVLARRDLPSEGVLAVIERAPPTVTRFALVVDGHDPIVLRRRSSTVPTLDISRRELKLGDQVIAIEPADARTRSLAAALRALREKRIELVVDARVPVGVLAEVAATAAPLFEEVRLSAAEPPIPTDMTVTITVPDVLLKYIDAKPMFRCVHASFVHDKHVFPALSIRFEVRVAADGRIENANTYGHEVPQALAECLARVTTHEMRLPPGVHEIPISVGPK